MHASNDRHVTQNAYTSPETLRASEARYRALATASADVIYRMSPDWSEMRELDGRGVLSDTTEPSGTWLSRYVLPEDRLYVLAAIDTAVHSKTTFELEHRVVRGDGTPGWTFSRAVPVLDAAGQIVEWIGAATDVTERKRNEHHLRNSEERFRSVADSGLVAICFFDETGAVVEANDAFREMFHATREDVSSRALTMNTLAADASIADASTEADHPFGDGRRAGVVTPYEKEYVRSDGTRFWALVAGRRMSNGQGVGFVIDIDERKRAEQRQAILADVSRELVGPLDVGTMMERLCEKIGRHFGVKWCAFAEVTAGVESAVVAHQWSDADVAPLARNYRWLDYGSPETMAAHASGEPRVMDDTQLEPSRIADRYHALGVRAFISLPLFRDDAWRMQVWISDNKPRRWSGGDVALLRELADHIWLRLERAHAESALRESERLLATVFEVLPVGVGVMNKEGAVVLSNAEMRRYLPTSIIPSHDDVRRWRWRATHPDGTRAESNDFPTARALRGETVLPGLEMLYAQEDGREIWTRRAGVPLLDADGRVAGAVAAIMDIDELKRADHALRETQARLEEALTTARMAYWTWDPRTKSTVASRSMDELFGVREGETLSSSTQRFQIVHPDDRKRHRELVEKAAARSEGWHTEFRVIRARDGEVAWLEERATVTRDPVSGEIHTTGLVWDVTDRKRAEAAADLERRALDRDAMRRALASAEESERRRLARDLHDQLGQHLTALMLGLVEARRLLDAGQPAQGRLTQLEDLVRLMTRDARYLAVQLRPPELDDVGLESALQSYVEQWSGRYGVTADVAVTGAEANRMLPSDVSAAIYRIAQEALTNIAKHADASQVSVLLERPERELRLIVEDDGRGFDLVAIDERVKHGRNIGLESMRERVALIGGTLEVESSEGHGTTIYVRAPVPAAGGE